MQMHELNAECTGVRDTKQHRLLPWEIPNAFLHPRLTHKKNQLSIVCVLNALTMQSVE